MKLLSCNIKMPQALTIVIIGVFLFSATFSMTFRMRTDEHGNMSGCPFTSKQTSICPMGIVEHIAKWQQLFTAAFFQSDVHIFILLLLLTFVLYVFSRAPNTFLLAFALSPPVTKNHHETKLFSYLVIIFAQGILHPRLYA